MKHLLFNRNILFFLRLQLLPPHFYVEIQFLYLMCLKVILLNFQDVIKNYNCYGESLLTQLFLMIKLNKNRGIYKILCSLSYQCFIRGDLLNR
jgi:hypothetical protein